VAGIPSGGLPWTTTGGRARVNLTTGQIAFNVSGLVLNGGNASGTPDGVANVKGTLVCNPGTPAQSVHDTATVPLGAEGDADFIGTLGSLPACANPRERSGCDRHGAPIRLRRLPVIGYRDQPES
jgi:hypothetical protein